MTAKTNEQKVRIHTKEKLLQVSAEGLTECSGSNFKCHYRMPFSCAKLQVPHMLLELHGAYGHTG